MPEEFSEEQGGNKSWRILEREGVAEEVRKVMQNQSSLVFRVLVKIRVFTLTLNKSLQNWHFKSNSLIVYFILFFFLIVYLWRDKSKREGWWSKKQRKHKKMKEESRNEMVQTLMIAMEVVRTGNSRYILKILDVEHERRKGN